ncbi:three-helix bundle dimerization domain-containing protein [Terrabacter sp. 2RAF25]|uniref:three-helix bundle dimerization domain-containing protein n=1 Tax=Terrabacter sp. 2RAF25 TaxID=3232998 RepID=UPI003F94C53D
MDRTDELRALADVQARLEERFPDLDSEVVEAAVRVSHSQLTGHVRDFVPVLVEHAARDRLAFAARDGDSGGDPPPGAPGAGARATGVTDTRGPFRG